MSFATVSKKKEDLQQGGNSKHINKSGMFPVEIIVPIVSSKEGSKSTVIDLLLDHEGQNQVIYGNMRITNNDGKPNEIGSKLFNQLMVIAGIDECANPVEADLPIGKKESMKTVMVLEDLADTPVVMRVQMEYSVWNGNIQESKVIRSFYRASDMASAEEIVNESEPGVQYAKDLDYASNTSYKDDLTEDVVKQWIADKRPKGTASNAPTAEKAPSFGKKRSFGK